MRGDGVDRRTFGRMVLASSVAYALTPRQIGFAQQVPRFEGTVIAEWLPNGRDMKLLSPFEYIARDNTRWPVPIGTIVDGASIPSPLWSLIGGPFEGLYRAASVVHDYYCDVRTRSSNAVHGVFHEAMLTSGVERPRAWLMYQGVVKFGPSWPDPRNDPACENPETDQDFERCARNSSKPPISTPELDKDALAAFVDSMEGQADPKDLSTLRNWRGS